MIRRRAVTFDLWHTLLYLEPVAEDEYIHRQWELGTAALLPPRGAPSPTVEEEAEARRVFVQSYRDAVDASTRGISISPRRQIENAGEKLGTRSRPEQYLADLEQLVLKTPLRPSPGVLETLRETREQGIAIGVISNTVGEPGAFLLPICRRLGIADFVDLFVWSDELAWTKPSPEIFLHALKQLGAEPSEAVHVGDGLADIVGAERAGYRAGVLFTGLQQYGEAYRRMFMPGSAIDPETKYSIRDLRELPPLLEKILA